MQHKNDKSNQTLRKKPGKMYLGGFLIHVLGFSSTFYAGGFVVHFPTFLGASWYKTGGFLVFTTFRGGDYDPFGFFHPKRGYFRIWF